MVSFTTLLGILPIISVSIRLNPSDHPAARACESPSRDALKRKPPGVVGCPSHAAPQHARPAPNYGSCSPLTVMLGGADVNLLGPSAYTPLTRGSRHIRHCGGAPRPSANSSVTSKPVPFVERAVARRRRLQVCGHALVVAAADHRREHRAAEPAALPGGIDAEEREVVVLGEGRRYGMISIRAPSARAARAEGVA